MDWYGKQAAKLRKLEKALKKIPLDRWKEKDLAYTTEIKVRGLLYKVKLHRENRFCGDSDWGSRVSLYKIEVVCSDKSTLFEMACYGGSAENSELKILKKLYHKIRHHYLEKEKEEDRKFEKAEREKEDRFFNSLNKPKS